MGVAERPLAHRERLGVSGVERREPEGRCREGEHPALPRRSQDLRLRRRLRPVIVDEQLLGDRPTAFDAVDTAADDPAQLYYSSGTTGLAKGILHAHRYVLAHEEFTYCHDVKEGELNRWVDDEVRTVELIATLPDTRAQAGSLLSQPEGEAASQAARAALLSLLALYIARCVRRGAPKRFVHRAQHSPRGAPA